MQESLSLEKSFKKSQESRQENDDDDEDDYDDDLWSYTAQSLHAIVACSVRSGQKQKKEKTEGATGPLID